MRVFSYIANQTGFAIDAVDVLLCCKIDIVSRDSLEPGKVYQLSVYNNSIRKIGFVEENTLLRNFTVYKTMLHYLSDLKTLSRNTNLKSALLMNHTKISLDNKGYPIDTSETAYIGDRIRALYGGHNHDVYMNRLLETTRISEIPGYWEQHYSDLDLEV